MFSNCYALKDLLVNGTSRKLVYLIQYYNVPCTDQYLLVIFELSVLEVEALSFRRFWVLYFYYYVFYNPTLFIKNSPLLFFLCLGVKVDS